MGAYWFREYYIYMLLQWLRLPQRLDTEGSRYVHQGRT